MYLYVAEFRINVRTTAEIKRDIEIAARLRGMTVSSLINSLAVKAIREEKILEPDAFIAPKREHSANRKTNAGRLAPVVAHISGAPDPKDEVRRMIGSDEIKEIERRIKVPVLKQKAK